MHRLLKHLAKPQFDLAVLLTNDTEIRELNREYRGIDKATDVLSFSQYNPNHVVGMPAVLGDVIISVDTAQRQAESGCLERLKASMTARDLDPTSWGLDEEITFLALHGVLHLIGYDHLEETDACAMESMEAELLPRIIG